jgi:hypothetical protein
VKKKDFWLNLWQLLHKTLLGCVASASIAIPWERSVGGIITAGLGQTESVYGGDAENDWNEL